MLLVKTHFVHCEWDDDAKVWFVAHSTVPGLSAEAAEPAALVEKLRTRIPELLALNEESTPGDREVPVELLWQGQQRFTLHAD